MKKRSFLAITLSILFLGFIFNQNAEATQSVKTQEQEQSNEHHHHRFLDETVLKSLLEKGYTKKEIFIAAHIAKFSEKKVEDILSFYKENDSSWEKTADHYGVDLEKIKKHHHHKEKFLKEHKEIVIQNLTEYSGKTAEEIQSWLDDGISLRFIVLGSAMAKASNTDLSEVIKLKKEGHSLKEIKKKLNLERDQIHEEMKKLIGDIKKDIKESKE